MTDSRRPLAIDGDPTGKAEEQQDRAARLKDRFAQLVFFLSLCFGLLIVLGWATQPLLEQHSFRQTQTALSTYWLLQTGDALSWLRYETPVFGSPWRIPMEFPLFQWLVASLVKSSQLPLDVAGRLMSAVMFYACLWPLSMLVRDLGFNRRLFYLAGGLLLLSPVYAFWSRTFLIESTALFLSLMYLALLMGYLRTRSYPYVIASTVAGTLAVLVKVTTFMGFSFAAGLLVLGALYEMGSWRLAVRAVRVYLPPLLGVLVCLAALKIWVWDSDAAKSASLFGHILTASGLKYWNFGTVAQRLSPELWRDAIWFRAVPEAIGSQLALCLVALALVRSDRRNTVMMAALVLLFLLPFLVFTNLHIVHNYYQCANAIFLVLLVSVALWRLSEAYRPAPFIFAGMLVVAADVYAFSNRYLAALRSPVSEDPILAVSRHVAGHTDGDSVILLVGCGWNPAVAYYSQRRAIYVPSWARAEQLEAILASPPRYTDGRRIGAIVERLGGSAPVSTRFWRTQADKLGRRSETTRFADYRVIVLDPAVFGPESTLLVAADDGPVSAAEEGEESARWLARLPDGWSDARWESSGIGNLDRVILGTQTISRTSDVKTVHVGTPMELRGWVADPVAGMAHPEALLALRGRENWNGRYLRTTREGRPDVARALGNPAFSNSGFHVLAALPEDLPEDVYEMVVLQNRRGKVVALNLGLNLHVIEPLRARLPPGWSSSVPKEVGIGTVDSLKVDGGTMEHRGDAVLVKRGSRLEMRGWVVDALAKQAHPELVLMLSARNQHVVRYISGTRWRRPDVSEAHSVDAYEDSGFEVGGTIPLDMPADVYALSILQKSADGTVELKLWFSLLVAP